MVVCVLSVPKGERKSRRRPFRFAESDTQIPDSMDLDEALSEGQTAYLAKEGGNLQSRSLTLYAVRETGEGRVIERRETQYEALQPPRFLESPEVWWMPGKGTRERVDPSELPLDVETSERWETSGTAPDALDTTGLDTAGKTLAALQGTPPEEAAQSDPEPPFTEGFEVVEEAAENPPGQSGEVEEGPPEIGSHTEHLERMQE